MCLGVFLGLNVFVHTPLHLCVGRACVCVIICEWIRVIILQEGDVGIWYGFLQLSEFCTLVSVHYCLHTSGCIRS